MPLVAVLDASVLFPISLCDLLLRLAERDLYRPRWSALILEETRRSLARRLGVDAEQRVAAMTRTFRDALVPPAPRLERTLNLPDPDDRHVVATAVSGGASLIVTHNLRDFPAPELPAGISAEGPDTFLQRLLDFDHDGVLECIRAQAADTGRHGMPTLTLLDVLHRLERAGVPDFASAVHPTAVTRRGRATP